MGTKDASQSVEDAWAFAALAEVLAGRGRLPLDGRASKVMSILLGGRATTDAVITAERFEMHFGPKRRPKGSSYFRRTSPAMVSELMMRAGVAAIAAPMVLGLPQGRVDAGGHPAWSYASTLVWVVPSSEAVKVIVRPSPERLATPFARDIPQGGPLALRELPEWTAEDVEDTDFAGSMRCPQCGESSTRYRRLGDALVCLACHRSFEG